MYLVGNNRTGKLRYVIGIVEKDWNFLNFGNKQNTLEMIVSKA